MAEPNWRFDLEIPNWTKWLLGGVAIGAVLGAGAVVLAQAPVVTSFSVGETLSADKLNTNLGNLKTSIVDLQNAVNNPPEPTCPRGYTQDATVTLFVVCKKGVDEVVKVGTCAAAFWIDRYEASIWQNADGSATQYGLASATDYPATFPANGQYTAPLYAMSKKGVQPSAHMTWFQAAFACRAGGKRLPNGEEWLAAAMGTNDPGSNTGTGGACVTNASGPRATGQGVTCVSTWGAQDMIGNLWEWTAEWYAGLGNASTPASTWPAPSFGGDGTSNIASSADDGVAGWTVGLPAAALRGGGWGNGSQAGVFSLHLGTAPSYWSSLTFGVRCVLPGR